MEDSRVVTAASGTQAPQRPALLTAQFIDSSDSTTICLDSKLNSTSAFLLFWLTGWTAGCAGIVRAAIITMDWRWALAAVPYIGAWFAVAGLLLNMWRYYESLTIHRDGLLYKRVSIFGTKFRQIRMAELRKIEVVTTTHYRNRTTYEQPEIKFVTSDRPLNFGQDSMGTINLSHTEAYYLKNEILRALRLHGGQAVFDRLFTDTTAADATDGATSADVAAMGGAPQNNVTNASPSSASLRFRVIDTSDTVIIKRPYDWSIGKIVRAMLFTALCNGIAGSFVTQLIKGQFPSGMRWFLLVFVIPHMLVSPFLIGAFIGELLGPVRKRVWEISNDRLVRRSCVAMFQWITPYDPTSIVTVRRQKVTLGGLSKFASRVGNNDAQQELAALQLQGPYELAFLDAANKPVLTIPHLTEVEADAIERPLRMRVPRWFGS